jgi:hypothetical protein
VVHAAESDRNEHPDYIHAKAGEHGAAIRLVCSLLSDEAVGAIERIVAGEDAILVPVRALEISSVNLIPEAMAHELGQRLGLEVCTTVFQTNRVRHTRARAIHRFVSVPTFAGEVLAGRAYALVDDHVGLGGTLASLKAHIENHDGRAALATTLTASRQCEVLELRHDTLQALRRKHGEALEILWREQFGYGLDALTEAEAGNLLRQSSTDTIRTQLARAREQSLSGVLRGDARRGPPSR